MCGGTSREPQVGMGRPGLSPRVRGNRLSGLLGAARLWSIPACAGEPPLGHYPAPRRKVYPRVCGGTGVAGAGVVGGDGLSPRVRGNPLDSDSSSECRGSIPACAGEPAHTLGAPCTLQVYPRVCGGTEEEESDPKEAGGLSPRVRGNPFAMPSGRHRSRSIPACAGEP